MATSFIGLSDNNVLVSFNSNNLSQVSSTPVKGIDGSLLGIDTRPANGLIYGVTTANKIYTIDSTTGIATQVGTLDTPFTAASVSGFDFNPVADRLRLVGDNDQNFRVNVDTGAVTVDGNLAYAAEDVNAGDNPSVTAAAYTNSFAGTTATQLYDIDTQQDTLVLQNPPNSGTLGTIGNLGVDFGSLSGFDIVSSSLGNNAAFATSSGKLYSIDLGTGAATNLGTIGSGYGHYSQNLKGLVAAPAPDIDPIATNSRFLALSNTNTLASFNPSNPSAVRSIAVTGLQGEETLLAIDTRPANGLVYGLTTASNLYTINPNSGAASLVSTLSQPFAGTSAVGFDFNPVVDRLRLVGDNDQNFRVNVDTGEVTVDGNLAYAAGDANASTNPTVTAAAYTNAIASPTSTQLYDIDTNLDVLTLQNPPNNGTLNTVGALGNDFGTLSGFDVISTAEGTNAAFAVSNSTLYSINLQTGAASSLGTIGSGDTIYQGLATVDLGNNPYPDYGAGFDKFVGNYHGHDSLGDINANRGNSTPEDYFAKNPNNQAAMKIDDQVAYFGITSANPDGVSNLRSLGNNTFGFGDLSGNLGISGNNFNDAGFEMNYRTV
jgi:trimeric autotransporter adhesin